MDHLDFLFAGFAVFWAGIFVYLLWLQARLRSVQRELQRLEERLAEGGPAAGESTAGEPTAGASGPTSPAPRPEGSRARETIHR